MAFTEYQLKRLKPGAKRRIITETGVPPDLRGLQLWVFPSGSKTWVLRFKVNGKTRYHTLGSYPTITLASAHCMVHDARALIRDGNDPVDQAEVKKRSNRDAPTVQVIFEEFRDHYLLKKRRRPEHAVGILEHHILPTWGNRKARDITRREIIERVRDIEESGTPRVAEIVKGLLGQMYGYAVDTGLLDASPAGRIPVIGSRGAKRERMLSDEEIRAFWRALDTAKMVPALRTALRLLLVTGQRRQELALARWSDVNQKEAVWLIPATHAKNGKAHAVPLSPLALSLFGELRTERSAFVIPSRLKDDRPIDPLALTRAVRNNTDHFDIPAFTPHDLRRTAASGMASLGIQRFHVERVLNHADTSVTARYDRYTYLEEKRQALDCWARHLQAVLNDRIRVIPIKRMAAK